MKSINLFFLLCACTFVLPLSGNTATVQTKHGPREGRVLVRKFENVVVTIITEQKRIFQFYAKDVKKIQAENAVLVAKTTPLLEEPDPTSEKLASFEPGMEVILLEKPEKSTWIKVQGWGSLEGWVPQNVLTKEVEFNTELPKVPSIREVPTLPTETPSDIPAAATEPIDATKQEESD